MSRHAKGSCLVCTHAERAEIDTAIADGEPFRSIADRFGLSSSKVHSHKAEGHVSPEVMADGAAALVADGLLEKLTRLEADARRVQRRAEKGGDLKSAVAAIGQLVRMVETAARITGKIGGEGTVNVQINISEEDSIKMAMIYLQRRGWQLIPPIETKALAPAPTEAAEQEPPAEPQP